MTIGRLAVLVFACGGLVLAWAIIAFADRIDGCTDTPPDTVVIVDTVYAPPPGWSEAFRLDCRWIPEEGERP